MECETIIEGRRWRFQSSSNPDRHYTVQLNGENIHNSERRGSLSCDCPGWIYNAGSRRWCKHCDYVLKNELMFGEKIGVIKNRQRHYGETKITF